MKRKKIPLRIILNLDLKYFWLKKIKANAILSSPYLSPFLLLPRSVEISNNKDIDANKNVNYLNNLNYINNNIFMVIL